MRFHYLVVVLVAAFMVQCGSSSTSSSSSSGLTSTVATNGFPSGMAVASPTAGSSSSANIANYANLYFATVDAGSTYSSKASTYETIVAAASDEACQVTLPNLGAQMGNPLCYGPQLDYQGHPDATGGASDSGQLPGGDLGIWTASESSGEACTATKINVQIEQAASSADYVMLMAASMVCLMNRASTALPTTDGDSVTLTSELNTAIQVNNSSVTVTSATMENLADVTDSDGTTTRDVFKFSIVATDTSGSDTITTTSYMKHMPTASDNSTFKGRMWVEVEGASSAGDKDGVAITYELASSTSLKYKMLSANYQSASASTTIFDSTGNLDVSGDWTGNIAQSIIGIDPNNGYGDFSYAWQAGTGDDKARIFNGYTNSTEGCGFFGYGDQFNKTAGTASDNVIDGFICNWAGPGNDHSMSTTSGLSQKQCMTLNSTSGQYEADSTRSKITYAPTVSCNSSGSLGIKLSTESTYDTTSITNNLVTLSSDTDFANYTAPSAPDIPSGL